MQQREIEIVNKLGLHARASAKLTQLAAKYQCDVSLARNGRKINAKSIMTRGGYRCCRTCSARSRSIASGTARPLPEPPRLRSAALRYNAGDG